MTWSVSVPMTLEQFLQNYVMARANNDSMSVQDDVDLALKAWAAICKALDDEGNRDD